MKNPCKRTTMPWLAIMIFLLLTVGDSFGQFKKKLTFDFDFVTQSQLDQPIPGFPQSDQAEWEIFQGNVEFSFPLFKAFETRGGRPVPKRVLITKLSYHSRITQEILFGLRDEHFSGVNFALAYLQELSPSWYLNVMGGIGVAADDLAEISGSDSKALAALYFDKRTRSGWTWGLGFLFSQHTGENLVIPMIHLAKENQAKTFKFELLVPKISVDFALNSKTWVGLSGALDGDLYTVTDQEATLYDEAGNIVKENVGVELAFSEFKIGPHFKLTPEKGLTVSLQVGVSTARRFEFLAKDQGQTLRFPPGTEGAGQRADFDIEPNVFFKAMIGVEF